MLVKENLSLIGIKIRKKMNLINIKMKIYLEAA